MSHTTTCRRCGESYEESSEERANVPAWAATGADRLCPACWEAEKRDTIPRYRYRRVELYIDALQHDLTLVDLHQVAEWIATMEGRPKGADGLPAFDHDPLTIAARLRDLHDSLTAYEERP